MSDDSDPALLSPLAGARVAAAHVLGLARRLRARAAGDAPLAELAAEARRVSREALAPWLCPVARREPPPPKGWAKADPYDLAAAAVALAEDVAALVDEGLVYARPAAGESWAAADRRLGPAGIAWERLHALLHAIDARCRAEAAREAAAASVAREAEVDAEVERLDDAARAA